MKHFKCKQCGTRVKRDKKTLKHYRLCMRCLPEDRKCRGHYATGGKCQKPALPNKDYCNIHIVSGIVKCQGKREYVYIMSLGFDDLYKIGKTLHPLKRMASLRAGNPYLMILYKCLVDEAGTVESLCHYKFKKSRVEREIFRLNKIDIDIAICLIKSHASERNMR